MEERILIGTDIESPCAKCKEIDFCDGNCEQYEKFEEEFKPGALKVYTRQEAIKKISSHLLMCDISTMDTDEIAEAALNALLEVK